MYFFLAFVTKQQENKNKLARNQLEMLERELHYKSKSN